MSSYTGRSAPDDLSATRIQMGTAQPKDQRLHHLVETPIKLKGPFPHDISPVSSTILEKSSPKISSEPALLYSARASSSQPEHDSAGCEDVPSLSFETPGTRLFT